MLRHRLILMLILLALPAICPAAGQFRVDESDKNYITVYEGNRPVYRYVRGEILAPGVPEDRRRSTYIHPIYSIDGKPLTDDFPKDHYHHRGLSWMWLTVRFDGVTKDLWTLKGIRQHYRIHESQINADNAVLRVQNVWTEDSSSREILNEEVTITAYPTNSSGRIMDCELKFSAIDAPVSIGVSKTGYSGFNLRFGPRKDTQIVTSKGAIAKDEDRTRYGWADLSARFNESSDLDGITVFDHKSNPHYPSGWTLRHYGDLNPAFTSTATDYTIEPGRPLTLKYRLYIHRDKADPVVIDKLHREFNDSERG